MGRPPIPPSGAGRVEGGSVAGQAAEPFSVARGSEVAAPSSLLDRLQQGELSVDQYLEARVDEAVAPIGSGLSSDELEFVKNSLRAELQTDPVLIELVMRATGANAPHAR